MKKNRKVYHYKLRGLKKLRQSKIKLSVSRSMMTSKNRNYWKSARAVRKNRYNNTPVVDGIHGNSEIANVFKSKFSALYSSVPTTTEAMESLNENIDINVRNHCTDNANETDGHTHCHVIERNHVKSAIDKLKSSKIDQNGCIFSDSIIHGTELLFDYVCILFNAMICHSYAPPSFIKSSIIPIPKGTKATLTDSDKYRSIAISSILSKVLDYIIIDNQKLALQTSDYQFGFKSKSSTVLCTTMVTETIQYYTENGCKGVFLLLLDASKAFDKVVFHMLFNELIKKNVCTKIIKLLLYMYTNQDCDVQWEGAHSNMFKIFNGVKQGSVISPLLFTLYIDSLFLLLKQLGLGCHVGLTYAGAFGYADDIALVAPSLYCLKKMISICETFANKYSISFNPSKSKLLCFNVDSSKVAPVFINGKRVEVVQSDVHLGNYISTNITDRNIVGNVCDLYQRSNSVISDFNVCDSVSLDSLHQTYCMHMYGCELWNLSCSYVNKYIVAWRKIKRRLWRLPYTTHNNIVHNLSNDVAFQLDKRIVCFIHNALNHSNKVCRLLLLAKLHSISSTFATNYRHLCYKYELVQSDWHSGLAHLLGKVKMKYQNKNSQNCPANMSIIRELCDIRDGRHIACDIISKTEVCSLLDIICTE